MCSHNSFQCGICCFLTENKKKSSTKTEPREESNQTRKLNQEGNGTQGTATFTINIRRQHSRRRTLFHCSVWLLYFCFLISSQQQSSNKVSSCSICTCTHFFSHCPRRWQSQYWLLFGFGVWEKLIVKLESRFVVFLKERNWSVQTVEGKCRNLIASKWTNRTCKRKQTNGLGRMEDLM